MKLVIDKKLANNNYEVSINMTEIAPDEAEMFSDFGNIVINIGGELKDSTDVSVLATLGDAFKTIPTELPLVKVFTQAQYGAKAEEIATSFAKSITTKIETAVTALKLKTDSFSGSTEVLL